MRDPDEVYESVKKTVLRRKRRKKTVRVALLTAAVAVELAALVIGVKVLFMNDTNEKHARAQEYEEEGPEERFQRIRATFSDERMAELYFPNGYTGYRYPVLPLMSTWPYGNPGEMLRVCQIPEDVLATMSTDELLQSVLMYPMWINAMVYSSMEQGNAMVRRSFNGLAELCEREDRCECLLKLIGEHPDWFEPQLSSYDNELSSMYQTSRSIYSVIGNLIQYHGFEEVQEEVYRKLRIVS